MRRVDVSVFCTCLMMLSFVAPSSAQNDPATDDAARRAARRGPAAEVYEKWNDSVVFVNYPQPQGGNPLLNEFFHMPNVTDQIGFGAGFLLHESGYVLTCGHAVNGQQMNAMLSDGKNLPAELIGIDRTLDLAVLKISSDRPLKPLILGRPRDIIIGETAITIGAPHGLRHSVSAGVISALGRDVGTNIGMMRGMIQTDAAINPGNSGGPLMNVHGEVLGIVCARKDNAVGVGFALPAEAIRRHLPRLLDIEHRLGTPLGLVFAADGSGRVEQAVPGSAAAKAGIAVRDQVTHVEGKRILSETELYLHLLGVKPGGTVNLTLNREGKSVKASLVLGAAPMRDVPALIARLGLKTAPLKDEQVKAMKLRSPRGLVVTEVQPGIYPEAQKIEPGDVLARIDDFRPANLDHVGTLLGKVQTGQVVRLVFLRMKGPNVTRIDVNLPFGKPK